MPLENPFRSVPPKELDPNQEEFLRRFGWADDEGLKAAGVTGNDEGRMVNGDGLDGQPIDFDTVASDAEKEAYESEHVECGGIDVTRNEKENLMEIIKKINIELSNNGQPEVQLGKEVMLRKITIGGNKDEQRLLDEITADGIKHSPDALRILTSRDFFVQENVEEIMLMNISVADLGFPRGASYDQICERAFSLGLEMCPPETGPEYCLTHNNNDVLTQPFIFMKGIEIHPTLPYILGFAFEDNEPTLVAGTVTPDRRWLPDYYFVFKVGNKTKPNNT